MPGLDDYGRTLRGQRGAAEPSDLSKSGVPLEPILNVPLQADARACARDSGQGDEVTRGGSVRFDCVCT